MYYFQCFIVSLLFYVVLSRKNSKINTNTDGINYRLPNNTQPENYEITLVTNIDKYDFYFSGEVIINVRVSEASSYITLHARQLTIKTVKLVNKSGTVVDLNPFAYNVTTEFLTIPTRTQLQKDTNYILTVNYTGELRRDSFGFYRQFYVDSQGRTKWLAATQFEPTDARHAFPCYDEPGFKAKFIIHIEHGESFNAISNMKETRSAAVNGRVTTDFDETPPISTYLIAFIVSEFEYREFNATNGLPTTQRVFTSKDYINQTSYALIEGVTLLNAIGNYLQIPFVLQKLDHASIPYTWVGAMENWGLITYPQNRLLYDPDIHLTYQKLNITAAMAHELSHQWFGNLVSPKWWSYLWLNEGFATLFKYRTIDLVHPQLSIFHHFIICEMQPALHLDAQAQTHPMTFYVEEPEAIENMFDDISYCKAGSVIRMFMHAIGEETFKKGLNYYLTNNTYGIADEDTLFERLESAVTEDEALPKDLKVRDIFGSWSDQKGFPLLKVTRNYEDGSVALYQEKYNAILDPTESDSTTWWIPYNFASAKSPIFNETAPFGWLAKDQRDVVVKPNETGITWTNKDWLIFNRQQTGFYRVLYDVENYNLIIEELRNGDLNNIDPLNRAQILDDLHEFVTSGRILPEILCNTLHYLRKETSYAPWETAEKAIAEWNQNLQASSKLPIFKAIIARVVEPYYKKWKLQEAEREEAFDKLSRSTAVNLACEFGVSQCLEDTYAKFKEMINGTKIPPNIRGLVVTNGIRSASDDEIAQLWQIYLDSPHNDERSEIISSIRNIQTDSTLEFYLNKSIEDIDVRKKVGSSERLLLVTTVIDSGQRGVSLGIQFLSGDLEKVNATIGSVPTILTSIAGQIITTKIETKFIQLLDLAKKDSLISDEEIGTLKDTAKKRLGWQNSHLKSFEESFFTGDCRGGVFTFYSDIHDLLE